MDHSRHNAQHDNDHPRERERRRGTKCFNKNYRHEKYQNWKRNKRTGTGLLIEQ